MPHKIGENSETIFFLGRPILLPLLYGHSDGIRAARRFVGEGLLKDAPQRLRDQRVW